MDAAGHSLVVPVLQIGDKMTMIKLTMAMISCSTLLLVMLGCPDGNTPQEMDCVAGQACTCDSGSCTVDCPDGDCSIECGEGTTCDATCDGGACAMECTDAVACTLDCAGDSCGLDCSGDETETCEITGCSSTCALDCGGAESCENSCDPIDACATAP